MSLNPDTPHLPPSLDLLFSHRQVPDPRLLALANIAKSESVLPAVLEFVDIAGLVKGASQGEGLGNKFLANIRECDAIVQVAPSSIPRPRTLSSCRCRVRQVSTTQGTMLCVDS